MLITIQVPEDTTRIPVVAIACSDHEYERQTHEEREIPFKSVAEMMFSRERLGVSWGLMESVAPYMANKELFCSKVPLSRGALVSSGGR